MLNRIFTSFAGIIISISAIALGTSYFLNLDQRPVDLKFGKALVSSQSGTLYVSSNIHNCFTILRREDGQTWTNQCTSYFNVEFAPGTYTIMIDPPEGAYQYPPQISASPVAGAAWQTITSGGTIGWTITWVSLFTPTPVFTFTPTPAPTPVSTPAATPVSPTPVAPTLAPAPPTGTVIVKSNVHSCWRILRDGIVVYDNQCSTEVHYPNQPAGYYNLQVYPIDSLSAYQYPPTFDPFDAQRIYGGDVISWNISWNKKADPLIISTISLADGLMGSVYTAEVTAVGGSTPYAWGISSGILPPGLTASPGNNERSMRITGAPQTLGNYQFTITVAAGDQSFSRPFSINITQQPQVNTGTIKIISNLADQNISFCWQLLKDGAVAYYQQCAPYLTYNDLPIGKWDLQVLPKEGYRFTQVAPEGAQKLSPGGSIKWEVGFVPVTSNLNITSTAMPDSVAGADYGFTFQATGGTAPYTWDIYYYTHPCCVSLHRDTGEFTNRGNQGVLWYPTEGLWNIGIQVKDATGASVQKLFKWKVNPPSSPAVRVVSPNGGETWVIGKEARISWVRNWRPTEANGLVDIYIQNFFNPSDKRFIAGGVADEIGFSWIVPEWLEANSAYKIIVTSRGFGSSLSDESDNFFNVRAQTWPSITLISPNGGEALLQNRDYTISWVSENAPADAEVVIILVGKDEIIGQIAESKFTSGSYVWRPTGYTAGNYYSIKVLLQTTQTTLSVDMSNGTFIIVEVFENKKPSGWVDSVSADGIISGWAYDPNNPGKSTQVHAYFDGPAGSGTNVTASVANVPRSDVNDRIQISGDHGFLIKVPDVLKDGKPHTVFVHGIDLDDPSGGSNELLRGSGRPFILGSITTRPTDILPGRPTPRVQQKVITSTIKDGALYFYDDKLWIIEFGQRRVFWPMRVFSEMGYSLANVRFEDISSVPIGLGINTSQQRHPRGTVVKGGDIWYFIGQDLRYPMTTLEEFSAWGHLLDEVVPANSFDLTLPVGQRETPSSNIGTRGGDCLYGYAGGYCLPPSKTPDSGGGGGGAPGSGGGGGANDPGKVVGGGGGGGSSSTTNPEIDSMRGKASLAVERALKILDENEKCREFLSNDSNNSSAMNIPVEDRDALKVLEAVFADPIHRVPIVMRDIGLFARTILGSGRTGQIILFPPSFRPEVSNINLASIILHEVGHMTYKWDDLFPNNYYGGIDYQDALSVNCGLPIFISHPR